MSFGGTKVMESDRRRQRSLGEETGSRGGVRGFMQVGKGSWKG